MLLPLFFKLEDLNYYSLNEVALELLPILVVVSSSFFLSAILVRSRFDDLNAIGLNICRSEITESAIPPIDSIDSLCVGLTGALRVCCCLVGAGLAWVGFIPKELAIDSSVWINIGFEGSLLFRKLILNFIFGLISANSCTLGKSVFCRR